MFSREAKKPNLSPEPEPAVNQVGVLTDKKIILQDSGADSGSDFRKVYLFDPVSWQSESLFEGQYRVLGLFQNHLLVKGIQPASFFEYDFFAHELAPLNFPKEKHWSEEHYQSVGVSDMFVGEGSIYVTRTTIESADEWNGDAMAFHPYEKFVYSFADNTYIPLKTAEQKFSQILSKNQNSKAKNHSLRGLSTDGQRALFSEFEGYYGSKNLAWVDLDNLSVKRVIDDSYDYGDKGDNAIGAASLNPSGTRMTYRIEREDGPHMELVSTDNISVPITSVLIPISLITRLNGDENTLGRERISAWLDDERVLVSYGSGLALVDFSEKTVKELYLDTTMGTSYTEWDFYVFGSDGKRYVAVTDWDNDSTTPCPGRPKTMCPEEGGKSILKAVLIDTETKEQRTIGENLNFVGWVSPPNIYRNEKFDFEFKYPNETQIEYIDEEFLSEEGEATEAVNVKKSSDSLVYIRRLKDFDINAYRNKWKKLDAIAANENEQQISRGEYPFLTDGRRGIKFDYCSYTLVGVNCDIVFSNYFFLLRDGSYVIVKINPWQYSEETMRTLSVVVESFQTGLAE